ncbi:MAG: SUMF1/EgtB/PvdO family nonheme iron enzyme [bacterium]
MKVYKFVPLFPLVFVIFCAQISNGASSDITKLDLELRTLYKKLTRSFPNDMSKTIIVTDFVAQATGKKIVLSAKVEDKFRTLLQKSRKMTLITMRNESQTSDYELKGTFKQVGDDLVIYGEILNVKRKKVEAFASVNISYSVLDRKEIIGMRKKDHYKKKPEPDPEPKIEPEHEPVPEPGPEPELEPKPEPKPEPRPEPEPSPPPLLPPEKRIPPGMSYIRSGVFKIGSINGSPDERPVHRVKINHIYVDKSEVTNEKYKECVKAGKCKNAHYEDLQCNVQSGDSWKPGEPFADFRGPERPVVCVTWDQAKAFCEYAGKRLPSEAEWEVAASSGQQLEYATDEGAASIANANIWDPDEQGEELSGTMPVMSFMPNKFDLYDLCGNVWEWCSDWYSPDYYKTGGDLQDNPKGPAEGSQKVMRGGAWMAKAKYARSHERNYAAPDQCADYLGFRCVQDPDKKPEQ